jgi:hypothetical protein
VAAAAVEKEEEEEEEEEARSWREAEGWKDGRRSVKEGNRKVDISDKVDMVSM